MINSMSFCDTCYKKVPATIEVREKDVVLRKNCCGGPHEYVIEKNPRFYVGMTRPRYFNILGDMCNIAITDDCNTSCRACYCKIEKREKSVEEVLGLSCLLPTWIKKVMLTGGEPTIHSRFLDIVENLNCGVITNGIAFSDLSFLAEFAHHRVYMEGVQDEVAIMFSLNLPGTPEYDRKMEAIENFRRLGLRLSMVSSTITDLEEVSTVLDEFRKIKDVVSTFKIRSAFNIGESDGFPHIFISELVEEVKKCCYLLRFVDGMHNNTYLVNTRCDDMHIMLVKCPDKTIIDICNIGPTGPYQLTHFNTFEDVVVALIVNEGIENGWFDGNKIERR